MSEDITIKLIGLKGNEIESRVEEGGEE